MINVKQRANIEGLRGIAVLLVVFFHSGLKIAEGGYIGVDIFFVTSGYLITKTIVDNFDNQSFSLLQFYERRFQRIIPAAIFVIIITGSIGLIFLLPEELRDLGTSIRSALILRSNTWAANSIDYFGISTEFKPLVHLWSLSIELQFYVLFPILLSLFLYLNIRKLFLASIFIAIIALIYFATIHVSETPTKDYFSSIMRSWELLLGALLCLSNIDYYLSSKKPAISNYFPGIGLFLIFISLYIVNQNSQFPGIIALLPCLGSAMILLSGDDSETIFNSILSNKALCKIGVISYSLYLIHQPLFAYFRILNGRRTSDLESILLIAASILFSTIIWALIEKPSQHRSKKRLILTYSLIIPCWFIIMFIAHQAQNQKLTQFHLRTNVAKILNFRYDNNPRLNECRTDVGIINPTKACTYGDSKLPAAAIWGDSHVDQLVMPLAREFNKFGYSIIEFSIAGCPPILDVEPTSKTNCKKNTQAILTYLINNKKIEHIFLQAYWVGYIDDGLISKDTYKFKKIKHSFKKLVSSLTHAGKIVHIIYPTPKMKVDPPLYLARIALIYPKKTLPYVKISNADFLNQSKLSIKLLDDVSMELSVDTIQPAQALYDPKSLNFYANNFKKVYYRDDNHLSVTGASKIAPLIAQKAFGHIMKMTRNTA